MIKSIKTENLIVTEKSYELLSKVEMSEIDTIYDKVSEVKNLIEDLSCDLEQYDIGILKDLNVCVGLDELSEYLGEYLNDRESYEQHLDEDSDEEEDSDDEYNLVGELKSEL